MKRSLLPKFLLIFTCFILTVFFLGSAAGSFFVDRYLDTHTLAASAELSREALHNSLMNIYYLVLLVAVALSLCLLLFLYFFFCRPLNKILHAAEEYAAGNLNYTFPVKRCDELGFLGASLQYMAGEINKSGEYQRKFISNISHDFRSPLTSIKGYVEAILDGTIPPEMQERYLKIVVSETERLNKLTSDLLTLNNFDDKKVLLNLSEFDINEVIRDTAALFEGQCSQKDISFHLSLTTQELPVYADKGRIQQVLYNLVDNAIKFSFPGSVIYLAASQHHQKVLVSVKDTGEGIPPESIDKIWERFYKRDSSRGKDKKEPALAFPSPKKSSRPTRNTSMWSALPEQEPNLPFPCQSQDIPWKYPIPFFDRNVQKMLTASQIFPKS